MPLTAGTRLGPYEILSPIGKGGMGEVYRARDTKLDRDVAIKVLPEEFAADPERLARFEREAKVLASLNHPNIAAIHGFEEADGVNALVLELVEGSTLAERIAEGPIPVDESLAIAKQIAEALEAGHEAGVIHRDLKPANIKLKEDGTVKVLDYGLAKALGGELPRGDDAELSQSPTLTRQGTQVGVILGTAAYMSPEQARGKRVDKRTDIFAFGTLLYEMLSGAKAFAGDDVSETLALVIKMDPDKSVLPSGIDPRLHRLLDRCLKKDLRERLRDIGEARFAIAECIAAPYVSEPAAERTRIVPVLVVVSVAAAAALLTWIVTAGSEPGPATPLRASITLPKGQSIRRFAKGPLAISPDGRFVAYAAEETRGSALFLRALDSFETRRLDGTDGADMPFFSPDSQWIGFFAAGKLKKVPVERGDPITLADAPYGWGGSWGDDGAIVYAPMLNAGLFRIPADGGVAERLTKPDFADAGYGHTWPQHLQGGRELLFTMWGRPTSREAVLDLDTGTWKQVSASWGAQYLSSGHLVFADVAIAPGLLAVPFDVETLSETGPPLQVLDSVYYQRYYSSRAHVSVSRTGTLVYLSMSTEPVALEWIDRSGQTEPIAHFESDVTAPRVSPEGGRILFRDVQAASKVYDIARGTVDTIMAENSYGVWHPEGSRVTLTSNSGGSFDMYDVPLGARTLEPLLMRENGQWATSWSPDGEVLAFYEQNPATGFDLWVLPAGREPVPILVTPFNESTPEFSPDGRYVAYVSDESGRSEVYVRTYPEGESYAVSIDGGEEPAWSNDGRELFYRNGNALFSVRFKAGENTRASAPRVVLEQAFERGPQLLHANYDVAPDGRLLVVSNRSATEIRVVVNWFSELERLVPTQ